MYFYTYDKYKIYEISNKYKISHITLMTFSTYGTRTSVFVLQLPQSKNFILNFSYF